MLRGYERPSIGYALLCCDSHRDTRPCLLFSLSWQQLQLLLLVSNPTGHSSILCTRAAGAASATQCKLKLIIAKLQQ